MTLDEPGIRHQRRSLRRCLGETRTAPTPRPQRGQPHVDGPLGGPSQYHGLWPWLIISIPQEATTAAAPHHHGRRPTITTAAAPTITTAAAPTITTAAAPTVITASAPTTAAAPTANVVMIGATGNAPTGAAPTVTTSLTQDDINEIIVALREQNDQLKADKTAASDRRAQLLEKALELVAEKKAVDVDDLEAGDKQIARHLVNLAMKGPANGTTNGAVWGGTQVLGAAPVVAGAVYAAAPATSQYLYPVQLVPVYFRPACNHHFWCNCPKTYP